jgi:hypothetical protein
VEKPKRRKRAHFFKKGWTKNVAKKIEDSLDKEFGKSSRARYDFWFRP